jgi:hypothetical protein
VGRMGAAIIAMESVALLVAVLAFGWPVLLIGAPLVVGTVIVLIVVRLWELLGQHLEQRRVRRGHPVAASPGLMTGFFEVSAIGDQPPLPPVDLRGPVQRVLALSDRLPHRVRELRRP